MKTLDLNVLWNYKVLYFESDLELLFFYQLSVLRTIHN